MRLHCVRFAHVASMIALAAVNACGGGQGGSEPAATAGPGVSALAPASLPGPPPATSPSPASASFPLHVDASKHYLVDAQNRPFLMVGDAAWSLAVGLSREEVVQYLDDRKRRGFNTLLFNIIEHQYAQYPPLNYYGIAPFTRTGDFSTPNDQYFANVDYIVQQALRRDFLLLIVPAYAGFGGGAEGWYQEMVANGAAKLQTYGAWLGNRYKGYPNVIWVQGGDYNVPDKSLVEAIAKGIRVGDPTSLQTAHESRGYSALDWWQGVSWLSVNTTYTDGSSMYAQAATAYTQNIPFFLIEAIYEGDGADEQQLRAQAYQTILAGGMGHVFGNNPVWKFGSGWQNALNTRGAASMTQLRNLFGTKSWWLLQPDVAGTFATGALGGASGRTVAARASDGSFALTYVPAVRDTTFALGSLTGPRVNATWVDPSSGERVTANGSPFPVSATRTLRPSRNNRAGYADWVLLLESTP